MLTYKPWKIESALQMLLGLFGGMALTGLFAVALGYRPVPGRVDHVMLIVGAFSFHGVGLLWLNWFIRDHEFTWWRVLGLRSPSLFKALVFGPMVGVVGFFVCQSVSGWVIQLMNHFQVTPETQSTVRALQTSVSTAWIAFFGIVSIVLAPVVEEFVFRGLIFPIVKQAGFPAIAWLGTSLLFAATHGNLQAFIPLTVLALMLAWVYDFTDNLMASILAHGTFNAINFVLTIKYGALLSAGTSS